MGALQTPSLQQFCETLGALQSPLPIGYLQYPLSKGFTKPLGALQSTISVGTL